MNLRREKFPAYQTIGLEEKLAANRVIDSGVLSGYLGSWSSGFNGGPEVRALEEEWAEYFGVSHAIAVNSATSALIAAMGALDLGPGDEVIVTPYSMVASASCPLFYGATPVFADVNPDDFCLDPKDVQAKITERTKAIVAVDLFGQAYDHQALEAIAHKHDLKIIEDAAQAIGAKYQGRFAGTLGDIGVFSLNCHKHIQCGEGGVLVCDDPDLAMRLRLIRNHAEAVVPQMGREDLAHLLGYNFRMTELGAAVARKQLEKMEGLVSERQDNCAYLNQRFQKFSEIAVPIVRPECSHAYYVHALKWQSSEASRSEFVSRLKSLLPLSEGSEDLGVRVFEGYCRPLYQLPIFGQVGLQSFCPVVEDLYAKQLFFHDLMTPGFKKGDLDDLYNAFEYAMEQSVGATV